MRYWCAGALLLLGAVPAAAKPGKSTRVCVSIVERDSVGKGSISLPEAQPAKDNSTTQTERVVDPKPDDPGKTVDAKTAGDPKEGPKKSVVEDKEEPPRRPLLGMRGRLAETAREHRHRHKRSYAYIPVGQTPMAYLKRLVEHFVTHQKGFVAVQKGCKQTILVELYPLRTGWTVFARYSGNGREERVDYLGQDELSQFAERAVTALLKDAPIATTVKRDTVLRADSIKSKQKIRGKHHFVITLGTKIRGGSLPTVDDSGSAPDKIRIFSPMTAQLGYRGKFEAWAIETMFGFGVGTSRAALDRNPSGGHVDYAGHMDFSMHFMRYLSPRGLSSQFFGAGATFELMFFQVIRDQGMRAAEGNRDTLPAGGVTADIVYGWEFMRASSVHWLIQAELNLPVYAIGSESNAGRLDTWFPGLSVKLGVLF